MVIAGTGHRPNKLGGYKQEVFDRLVLLATAYFRHKQPTKIISGMALGWDQAIAQAAIDLSIPLHAAVPCIGQDRMWPQESKDLYKKLLDRASEVTIVTPEPYDPKKPYIMQIRNEWMVDHCDVVVALYNKDKTGGTAGCIKYAQELEKTIDNLWDRWVKLNARVV